MGSGTSTAHLLWVLIIFGGIHGTTVHAGELTPLSMTPQSLPPTPQGWIPLVAAVHVHSTASTGSLSVDALAERAERLGLDAMMLTDNFALEYEYGLYPLDGVLRRTVSFPSLLRYGLARYLDEIAAAQARHPKVLLIPGAEVAPHYYWSGSVLRGDLTMHDSQKNLLVVGLSDSEDYATLPAIGNTASYRYDGRTALCLAPVALFVPAAWLWHGRSSVAGRRGRSGRGWLARRIGSLLLTGAALLLLFNAWPFSRPIFSAYDERLGYRPYQAVIDMVNGRGGLALWSMPEARDFRTYSFGRLGSVIVKTDPYPEALMLTQGYAGFGGLYQEARMATDPGGLWDQLIQLYASGQRSTPPVLVGETAFHGPDQAGKELDQVVTVLWVRDRTVAGVLDALRRGRAYAVERISTRRVPRGRPGRGADSRAGRDARSRRGARYHGAPVRVGDRSRHASRDGQDHPIWSGHCAGGRSDAVHVCLGGHDGAGRGMAVLSSASRRGRGNPEQSGVRRTDAGGAHVTGDASSRRRI